MTTYQYRLLNVFSLEDQPLSGNPLCVFEDARGLDAQTMQALALQFNLSETTFILPSDRATAQVRIFTPSYELPFAGHPTLGTAHVVRELHNTGNALTLQTQAGVIPVSAEQNKWTLQANKPRARAVAASSEQLAEMLGVAVSDLASLSQSPPLWVDAGTELLVLPLASVDAVARCNPKLELLWQHARLTDTRFLVYVWSPATAEEIAVRFFFAKGMSVAEDPATGAACAALGGWFISTGATLPVNRRVLQGAAVGRASVLGLHVDTDSRIFVSGEVIELGRGVIHL